MQAALRDRLRAAGAHSNKPRNQAEAVIKRLAEQLERARRLYEFGEYDWDTFSARRDEIQEQQRQLAEARRTDSIDVDWCEAQLLDLVAAWEAADPGQRSRWSPGCSTNWRRRRCPRAGSASLRFRGRPGAPSLSVW
jgi:hypothetical protein